MIMKGRYTLVDTDIGARSVVTVNTAMNPDPMSGTNVKSR